MQAANLGLYTASLADPCTLSRQFPVVSKSAPCVSGHPLVPSTERLLSSASSIAAPFTAKRVVSLERGSSCRAAEIAYDLHRPVMDEAGGLTPEQLEFYNENGYFVLEDFATPEECKQLIGRMGELVEGFDPSTVSVFSTKNQKKTTNDYFLNSGGNVSFFFEEKAFDEEGKLTQPKELSINKVGHALHDLDPHFRSFSRSEKVAAVMASLGYKVPIPVQSMYIFKQPGIGGEVVPHQDSTFLYTDPPSCTGFWVALEDATLENGCLWALPGSHKDGPARRFYVDESRQVNFEGEAPEYDLSKFVPVPVKAGSAVLLHGALVHNSYENKSPKSRHAYSIHVIESEGCKYLPDNWLQRAETDPQFEPLNAAAKRGMVNG